MSQQVGPWLRGCERIPSRRRAADASRRAALLLLAIACGYDSSSRLARRAPRPPGSVRGFIHNLSARGWLRARRPPRAIGGEGDHFSLVAPALATRRNGGDVLPGPGGPPPGPGPPW